MTDANEIHETVEQMQDTSIGLITLPDDELRSVLSDKGGQWQGQLVADLLADMPEGAERTSAQQRFADIKPSPPQLQLGPNDISKMDVGVMKSD